MTFDAIDYALLSVIFVLTIIAFVHIVRLVRSAMSRYDGELQIFGDDSKDTYRFIFYEEPEMLKNKKHLRIRIIFRE